MWLDPCACAFVRVLMCVCMYVLCEYAGADAVYPVLHCRPLKLARGVKLGMAQVSLSFSSYYSLYMLSALAIPRCLLTVSYDWLGRN